MLIFRYGYTRREHGKLRYNAPWLLIQFAIADGALDADHLLHVLNGNGDGPINWISGAEILPVCPGVDRQGNLTKEPMSVNVFDDVLRRMFAAIYAWARATIHMIRRAVGKMIDRMLIHVRSSMFLIQPRNLHRNRTVTTFGAK